MGRRHMTWKRTCMYKGYCNLTEFRLILSLICSMCSAYVGVLVNPCNVGRLWNKKHTTIQLYFNWKFLLNKVHFWTWHLLLIVAVVLTALFFLFFTRCPVLTFELNWIRIRARVPALFVLFALRKDLILFMPLWKQRRSFFFYLKDLK